VTADFAEIGALAVTSSERGLSALARERGVAYVERDEWRVPLGLADTQLTPSPSNGRYGLLTTTSTAAHARGWKGQGIKACVADTGLDTLHPDIAPN
jgi:subtilisin family serine protease